MNSLDYFTQHAERRMATRPTLSAASEILAYASVMLLAAMTLAAAGLSLIA